MSKQVLIIGGSYFTGRVFAMTAAREAGYSLTLVNRGTYSMGHLPNVREVCCDRHDYAGLTALPAARYDAVVDFCAYHPGDVTGLLAALPGRFDRYILLSTANVYSREVSGSKDEVAPLLTRQLSGPEGEYMYHKMLLEGEARAACAQRGAALTILRPVFIYSPYNYAPRESYFVEQIVKDQPIPVPVDADARFQFVYVKDVANAIIACVERQQAAEAVYNLSAPEVMTYRRYLEVLAQVSGRAFATREVTVAQVEREGIPLPFPLTAAEDELYSGEKIVRELGLAYTPFETGMERVWEAFKKVYEPRG